MWSYYGSKTNQAKHYPTPQFDCIIEPFAGAAKYSLLHWENDVILIDKYEVLINIWKWLQSCSENDILKLPKPVYPESVEDFNFDCEEAKHLLGFVIGCGAERPRKKATKRKTIDRPNHVNYNLKRISSNLHKIKHWKILHGSYEQLENKKATWFIDAPYQFGGNSYVESSRNIDFNHLGNWSKKRNGQVIVCENTKANWMDFKPMIKTHGSVFKTTEAIWSNLPTVFDNEQTTLFK